MNFSILKDKYKNSINDILDFLYSIRKDFINHKADMCFDEYSFKLNLLNQLIAEANLIKLGVQNDNK